MIKLLAYASLKHREITLEVAREALRDKLKHELPSNSENTLSADTIQATVAHEWGVSPEGLRSKTRTKALTVPRQIAMYFMRELLGMQLVEIGNTFGGRDHSTVIHSLERVAIRMREEPAFSQKIGQLRSSLESLSV
jgi:chromosomal replication initiator protein